MLRVTIEFIPLDVDEKTQAIEKGTIINDGTGSETLGNYHFIISGEKMDAYRVREFERLEHNSWKLLYECLKVVFEEKK